MMIEQDGITGELSPDEIAEDFQATHPTCLECHERCCPENYDGTVRAGHYECDELDGESVPGGFIHKACRPAWVTYKIRDEIKAGLLVRRGVEINELTASERANNVCLRVYELLRDLGVVEKEKAR